jgi:hypothetical protein
MLGASSPLSALELDEGWAHLRGWASVWIDRADAEVVEVVRVFGVGHVHVRTRSGACDDVLIGGGPGVAWLLGAFAHHGWPVDPVALGATRRPAGS